MPIANSGTYRVRVYTDHAVSDYAMRVDLGRGVDLEVSNDTVSANLLCRRSARGVNFAVGGLAHGTDAAGDTYALGLASAGSSLAATVQLPSSTLTSADISLRLFERRANDRALDPPAEPTRPCRTMRCSTPSKRATPSDRSVDLYPLVAARLFYDFREVRTDGSHGLDIRDPKRERRNLLLEQRDYTCHSGRDPLTQCLAPRRGGLRPRRRRQRGSLLPGWRTHCDQAESGRPP